MIRFCYVYRVFYFSTILFISRGIVFAFLLVFVLKEHGLVEQKKTFQ